VNPYQPLVASWRDKASELRPYAPGPATAFEVCAVELEAALRANESSALTLPEAAAESGYSADRLRHMIGEGKIPNVGRKGAPRIRRADLPIKAGRAKPAVSGFDAGAFARSLLPGGGGR
jgi:hypothetical protein